MFATSVCLAVSGCVRVRVHSRLRFVLVCGERGRAAAIAMALQDRPSQCARCSLSSVVCTAESALPAYALSLHRLRVQVWN